MRFIGYYIIQRDGTIKKFGAGERKAAEKAAKEQNTTVKTWVYKI